MIRTQAAFLGGRSGVGKSTVAIALHDILSEREIAHAVIEGDNLDLAYPAPWTAHPGSLLTERNLAAMWSNYRELGYRRLIYTNTVSVLQIPELSAAIGGEVEAVGILLRGSSGAVRSRLLAREEGAALEAHLKRSENAARRLDAEAPAEVHRLDTERASPNAVALQILTILGWG